MKDLLIVANWKSNKTTSEALNWLREISPSLEASNKKIVICPSFLSVPVVSDFIKSNNLPIEIGVQDISPYDDGAYTGEVSARHAAEFAKYAIIGHSERRINFLETDEVIARKAALARKYNLIPIVCVSREDQPVPPEADYISFEPIFAIGSGNPDDPKHVEKVFSQLSLSNPDIKLIYGGSVDGQNVKDFLRISGLEGFLVGTASLDASAFASLLKNAE